MNGLLKINQEKIETYKKVINSTQVVREKRLTKIKNKFVGECNVGKS